MVMHRRITDPTRIDAARIDSYVAAGDEVILQFSQPPYSRAGLRTLERLCAKHGTGIRVRFFAHYDVPFDGRALEQIPSVAALSLDCLSRTRGIDRLATLDHLAELDLGIDEVENEDVLAFPNLMRLKRLTVAPSHSGHVDLAPLARYACLKGLAIEGQVKNIEAAGSAAQVEDLRLSRIPRQVGLRWVNRLGRLRVLRLRLGGRPDIEEVRNETLGGVELMRVRGLCRLVPGNWPRLEHLRIEDQSRLPSLHLDTAGRALRSIDIHTCRGLTSLTGLDRLPALRRLWISKTGLDLDRLIASGLPRGLRQFGFYTGRFREDAVLRRRLDALGFTEAPVRIGVPAGTNAVRWW